MSTTVSDDSIISHCWVCAGVANSREHRIKKSDVEPLFDGREHLYINSPEHNNALVQGPNSKLFKFKKSLCNKCNGSLTQPYDLAWQALSVRLKEFISKNPLRASFNVNDFFQRKHQVRRLRQCHLYFVKWLGCQLIDTDCYFDKKGFANSLKTGTAYPDLYLKFGKSFWGSNVAGQSDLNAKFEGDNLVNATQIYDAGGNLSVLVIYAKSSAPIINALDGAWHPKMGTKIRFTDGDIL